MGHALAGATGSAISNAVTYPLQLLITRLQVQRQLRSKDTGDDIEYKGILDAAENIYYKEGGITAFYSGVGQEIAKSVADSFLFFLAYSLLRNARQRSTGTRKLAAKDELGIGMAAGAFSKLFTTPIQNIVTRKQTATMTSGSGDRKLTSMEIAQEIKHEKGWFGLWAGYSATLVLTTNPGLTFLLHELFERINHKTVDQEGSLATFVIAASAKAVASSVTYPFSLAKSRAQVSKRRTTNSHAGGDISSENSVKSAEHKVEAELERNTIWGEILKTARTEGVAGLYQGWSGEVLKGFFQHGLTMLMKDRAFQVIQQIYFLLLKVLRKYPSPEELAALAKERAERTAEEARFQSAKLIEQGKAAIQSVSEKL